MIAKRLNEIEDIDKKYILKQSPNKFLCKNKE